jgi:hypothetical protein
VDGNNRVKIPDAVFDAGILAPGSEAYWAYEQVVGFLIVSNTELTEKPKYKPQASSVVGGEDDDYRATIPKIFFDDYAGMGSPVPEKARVTYGETRHYVYRSEMVERETKSCYLLTREQLENTIATPDDWAGSMDSIPRFMCEQ